MALVLLIGASVAPFAANAVPTQTGNWLRGCQTGQATRSLKGAEWACYTPAAGADDESAAPLLAVGDCENVDIFLWDDFDGDATACTVTWDIEGCPPVAAAVDTDTERNAACTTLPGTTSLSGDDVESNLAALYLRVHGENAGANIDSCRIVVKCALEGSK